MMEMVMLQHFDPVRFYTEIIYSLFILASFLFIYFRTKDLYAITGHKGIEYFRTAILFFALAYASRLAYHLARVLLRYMEHGFSGRPLSTLSLIMITYLITVAIGYLIYSNLWKSLKHRHFLIYINVFAAMIMIVFMLSNSLLFLISVQLYLIAIILLINRQKKIKYLYALISSFWILNMIIFYL